MLKKIVKIYVLAAIAVVGVCCSIPNTYSTAEGVMMGTTMSIIADFERSRAGELYNSIIELDSEMKASMSIYDSTSLLSRINRNETDTADKHIIYNLRLADSISRLSGGAYDVTVKPLVDLWGFSGREPERVGDIDSILEFVGYELLQIDGERIVKGDERIEIDLNSIAKGYAVDCLAEIVEEYGAKNYIVEVGGEIRCKGRNPQGSMWRVGIETPFDGNMGQRAEFQKRINIGDGAIATSGNYRRFYLDSEGNKIVHTIDPTTGYSTTSKLLSVTVVAPSCAEADALATMFLAMGNRRALELAKRMPNVKAYFILAGEQNEYEEYISPAIKELIMN